MREHLVQTRMDLRAFLALPIADGQGRPRSGQPPAHPLETQ
jgi:hypothetical protein